jgi:urease accessory protein
MIAVAPTTLAAGDIVLPESPIDPHPADTTPAGAGRLRCSLVNGATAVCEVQAASPLKLLCLRRRSECAWIFASTYGGGLVAGDHIRLDAAFDPATRCFLGTQASTKIYRSTRERISRQSLHATLGADSLCVAAPDPIVCFAHARFQQRQRFDLDPSASLLLIDWLTSGRHANGERWAFDRYDSGIDVRIGGKLLVRETLLLDPADGPIGSRSRMGRFDCFATMILVGPMVRPIAEAILRFTAAAPVGESDLLFAASPLADGAICRIAGPSAQAVGGWMHDRLWGISAMLGESPWERKR